MRTALILWAYAYLTQCVAQLRADPVSQPTVNYQNTKEVASEPAVPYPAHNSLMDSKAGREQLVRAAFEKALAKTVDCYPSVLSGVLLRLNPRTYNHSGGTETSESPTESTLSLRRGPLSFDANGGAKITSKEGLNGWDKFYYVKGHYVKGLRGQKDINFNLSVEYAENQRKSDVYAEVIVKGKSRTFPKGGCFNFLNGEYSCVDEDFPSCSCDFGDRSRIRVNATNSVQDIDAKILIYPLAFNSDSFYMPTEKHTSYGAWAHSIEHALVFLILHEIGHIDYYIAQHGIIDFDMESYSNGEDDCDQNASSILKCVR